MTDNQANKAPNLFWPDVSTIDGAKDAAMGGVAISGLVALITGALATVSLFAGPVMGATPLSFIDAGVFALLSFGIYRMSRIAAVLALLAYSYAQWNQFIVGNLGDGSFGPILAVFLLSFLFNSIRGTFSYHRLRQSEIATNEAGHNNALERSDEQ